MVPYNATGQKAGDYANQDVKEHAPAPESKELRDSEAGPG